jgi:signal transduction histidine kinase
MGVRAADDPGSKLLHDDRAEVDRSASESLARQSSASVYGHWVLASVVILTASSTRTHPLAGALAAAWVVLVGCSRLAVGKSFSKMWPARAAQWTRRYRGVVALSSATWGFGGSFLLAKSGFDEESRVVLLALAGIAAAGIASTAADLVLLRLHLGLLLAPTLLTGLLFMPGSTRLVVGYAVVVACYAAFLSVQGGHAHASLISALVKAKLLERQTVELDIARREGLRRNQDMRIVLDTVSEGLVTIDEHGRLGEERSKAIDTWFRSPPAGTKIWDVFQGANTNVKQSLEAGLEQVFEDTLPIALTLSQLPRCIDDGGAVYELRYEPVDGAGAAPTRILVIVSDITGRVKAEKSELEQREQMSLFAAVAKDRAVLAESLRETGKLVAFVGEHYETPAKRVDVLRALHTVKGNSSLFGLTSISGLCDAIETRIAEEGATTLMTIDDRDALLTAWSHLALRAADLIGDVAAVRLEVTALDVAELASAIERSEPREDLMRTLAGWSMEPVAKRFEHLAEQTRHLAERLGKSGVRVETKAASVRLPRDRFSPFWNTLSHVLRNALDHGIESPSQRVAAGKPESGRLVLAASDAKDQVVIEITDDGRGIDWAKVREKARRLGLASSTESDLIDALFADGVTTRDEATEVSGRGLGLSAVRAACQKLDGRIQVESTIGLGTTLRFLFAAPGTAQSTARKATISLAPRATV